MNDIISIHDITREQAEALFEEHIQGTNEHIGFIQSEAEMFDPVDQLAMMLEPFFDVDPHKRCCVYEGQGVHVEELRIDLEMHKLEYTRLEEFFSLPIVKESGLSMRDLMICAVADGGSVCLERDHGFDKVTLGACDSLEQSWSRHNPTEITFFDDDEREGFVEECSTVPAKLHPFFAGVGIKELIPDPADYENALSETHDALRSILQEACEWIENCIRDFNMYVYDFDCWYDYALCNDYEFELEESEVV